jgi:hypothetical protein
MANCGAPVDTWSTESTRITFIVCRTRRTGSMIPVHASPSLSLSLSLSLDTDTDTDEDGVGEVVVTDTDEDGVGEVVVATSVVGSRVGEADTASESDCKQSTTAARQHPTARCKGAARLVGRLSSLHMNVECCD